MSDYESTIISNVRDDNDNRQSDCIITFGSEELGYGIALYKKFDANPKSIQNTIRSFYHWMDDERVKWISHEMDSCQLLVNLVYWIKRKEEDQDCSWTLSGKTETRHTTKGEWQTNHNIKNYMAFQYQISTDVQYIYKIDPDTQMMGIFEGHWNSDTKKFEKHESIGTIPVGQNYDATERVEIPK